MKHLTHQAKRIVSMLFIALLLTSLQGTRASAISLGCSKAQKEASSYLGSAFSAQNAEIDYLKKGMYGPAFSSFEYAHKFYVQWNKIVTKSPKCFQKDNYVTRVRSAFKGYTVNQTMITRYGYEIAKRNNFGSPDPCFKYLGQDNAYLECSMRNY
jgi:hypothetical protein